MTTDGMVVVDASLVLKWVLDEPYSLEARRLAQQWADDGWQLAAPFLIQAEFTNVLHQYQRRGVLSVAESEAALQSLLTIGLRLYDEASLYPSASRIARQLGQPAIYDSLYLALAEMLECSLWTADVRFQRVAAGIGSPVRWVASEQPQP